MNWIFRTILRLNGFPINLVGENIDKLGPKDILEIRDKRAQEIFQFHYDNTIFYRTFLKSKNFKFTDWKSIPIIQKRDIQRPLEEIIGNLENKSKLHIHNTSGSSGTPFVFAKDKFCHANAWAFYDRKLLDLGITYGSDLQARFYGIPKVGLSYWKERLKDIFAARHRYPVFDLSDNVLETVLSDFKRKKFVYINGYTNAIILFANFLIRKNIVLKDICDTLKCVIPTSEICTELHREILQKAFGVPVYIEYGAAELDVIAMENAEGEFLVNNQTLLVEIIDEKGELVSPGETGRVIVTSLFNKAMPFIRYELGDQATLSKDSGDIQKLKSVDGRINDTIKLPSGKISPGLTIYYVVKVLFEGNLNIQEFVFHHALEDFF